MTETQSTELLPLRKGENKSKHLSRKTSEILFIIAMLSIPVLQFCIFWIVPNFDSILMGFQVNGKWSLGNFTKFFDYIKKDGAESEIVYAIKNSLIYFAVNIFVCTPIVIFFSYVLFRKVPFSGAFKVIFYLPSIIGGTVTTNLYRRLFLKGAPVYNLLYDLGFITKQMDQIGLFTADNTAFLMIIIYSIWTCVGINMIMFHGAMKRIPQEIFESAEIDGVGFFRQFFDLVIPLIWPTISTLIVFSLSGMFVTYGSVMILSPSVKSASMIGWYIVRWTTATDNHSTIYYPAAVGLIFTVVGLPFVLFVRWLLNKVGENVEY